MRYFQTSNASRPYNVGGLSFTFEPIGQIGGNWLGVLAVEDDSAAGILAGASFPQVTELSAEEYDAVKKKPLSRNSSSYELPRRQQAAPVSPPAPAAPSAATAAPESPLPEPKTARVEPPDELPAVEVVKSKTAGARK